MNEKFHDRLRKLTPEELVVKLFEYGKSLDKKDKVRLERTERMLFSINKVQPVNTTGSHWDDLL